MPQKAIDITQQNYIKFLISGEFGSGKTTFATTFPKPILFFDFDDGKQTFSGMQGIDYESYGENSYRDFRRDFRQHCKKQEYKTYVIDSTTFLLDAMQQDILNLSGGDKESISLPQWQTVNSRFAEIFRQIRLFDAHFVVIGHEQTIQDDITKEIKYLPIMVGRKFPQRAPGYFDEVYRMTSKTTKDGTTYLVQTQKDRKYNCRTRFNLVDPKTQRLKPILDQYEPADFNLIQSKVQAARAKVQHNNPKKEVRLGTAQPTA